MEQIKNEVEIVADFFRLLSLAAELYEPLKIYQYGLTKGICLLFEEADQLDSLIFNLKQLEDVEIIYSPKTSKLNLPNYKLCIYAAQKYDKKDDIHNFLTSPRYLTAVIVGGSIPDNLPDTYKVFLPANCFSYSDARDLDSEISDIKDFLRSHPDSMENELDLFETCTDFMNASDKPPLYIQLLIAAKMYCLWHRSFHSEYETKSRHSLLLQSIQNIFKLTEENLDTIDLSSTIIKLFLNYTENNPEIRYATPDEVDEKMYRQLERDNLILFDHSFYYVSETLMKKICSPLLQSFRWLYIKENLRISEILYCNLCQDKNYTRKKALPNCLCNDRRPRFLWLRKKYFTFPDNLAPEERRPYNHENLSRNSRNKCLPDIR